MGMTAEERRQYQNRKAREYRERDPEAARAKRREYYAKNREKFRERNRQYNERNRDKILEQQRATYAQRYEQNREKIRERSKQNYQKNREWYLAYQREYYAKNRADWRKRYEENREERLERDRQRRQQNLEAARARDREGFRRNRDKILARSRIARFRSNHGLWPEQLAQLWDEQGGLCYLCGEEMTRKSAVDHDHSCCPQDHSCWICRRGLAHPNCNAAIGFAADDPDRLRAMADALESAQAAVRERKAEAGEQLTLDVG